METVSTVAIYLVVGMLVAAFCSFSVALLHHSRIRTLGQPALARSLKWSGSGFMLFSSCGLIAEMTAFGRVGTGYYIVIMLLFLLGAWMLQKGRELQSK